MLTFIGLTFIILFFIILPIFFIAFVISLIYHGAKRGIQMQNTILGAAQKILEQDKK